MKYLMVPIIMVASICGTVGILKLILHFFPNADKTVEETEEWIEKHG